MLKNSELKPAFNMPEHQNSGGGQNCDFVELCNTYQDQNYLFAVPGTKLHTIKYLFRGERKYHQNCEPTLYREDAFKNPTPENLANLTLKLCRRFMFEDMIKLAFDVNPHMGYLCTSLNLPHGIQPSSIFQHYGYLTDVLDLTSNLKVALFFAFCEPDRENGGYKYPKEGCEAYLYVTDYQLLLAKTMDPKNKELYIPNPIGLQPLLRSAAQSGFGLTLLNGEDFNHYDSTQCFKISYTALEAQEIFNEFNGGKDLFNHNLQVEKACKEINSNNVFTLGQFERAYGIVKDIVPKEMMPEFLRLVDQKLIKDDSLAMQFMSNLKFVGDNS